MFCPVALPLLDLQFPFRVSWLLLFLSLPGVLPIPPAQLLTFLLFITPITAVDLHKYPTAGYEL